MKTAHLLSTAAVLALLAPAAASAQDPIIPPAQPPATPPATPTPPPTEPTVVPPGKGSFNFKSGLADGKKLYVAAGQRVRLSGAIKPAVAGEKIIVELFRGSKKVDRKVVDAAESGKFNAVFRIGKAGKYIVKARHKRTDALDRFTLPRKSFEALNGGVGRGSGATKIKLVQKGLARLAYVTSQGGSWDDALSRAVIAFRKTNNMSRTSEVSDKVFEMLLTGHGGYKLKYPKAGKHVEADIGRQVLVLARDGKAERIYHTSSGAPATPTVLGSYKFYRKSPGTNAKGMVHSSYFIRGYAIHGYKSVPTYNASHGCLRVPIPNARAIFDWVSIGDQIFVYR